MEGIRMKWCIVSLLSLMSLSAAAQENSKLEADSMQVAAVEVMADSVDSAKYTSYERRTDHYRNFWRKVIPNQFTAQYAGSIGVAALGVGWHYGKHKNWETDLLLGFVPKYYSAENKVTFTVKERYVPWHLNIGSRWMVEPLTTGLFFTSIFGEDFWSKEPSRYPDRYYGFSTRVRANIFMGERITYRIPSKKRHFFRSISAYYELSTCDMYIISAIPNKNIRLSDILSLSFGLRLNVF